LVNTIADGLSDEHLRTTFLSSPLVMELRVNARSPIVASAAAAEEPTPSDTYPAGLTAREVAVLRLVAQGATNRQIAETLFISVKTVNAHMTNILNKIGCDNRTAATTFAVQHGLLE
jgi:DNA-binding NarL/FixJ family response regulator